MRTDTDTLLEAGRDLAVPSMPEGSCPVMLRGNKVVSLERYLARPYRARGTFHASDLRSASLFITKHRSPAHEVLASWRWGRLTVLLNFHADPMNAGWCDYKVTCWCRYDDACKSISTDVLKGAFKTNKA